MAPHALRARPRSLVRTSAARRLSAALGLFAVAALAAVTSLAGCGAGAPRQPEILWDTWGVPHIYGGSAEDLGFGYGWAQMQARGDQVLGLYALGRGRAAELWGEPYVASDRMMRELGIASAGDRALAAQSPEFRAYLEAFAAGMNAYADAHPDRIGEELRSVLPVTAADPLIHGMRSIFAFVAVTGNRPPLVGLDGLPVRRAAGTTSAAEPAGPARLAAADVAPVESLAGSNTWAIGPSRSASGNAMLLANPHLPWNIDMMLFFEGHMVGAGVDLYGVTLLGLPTIAIGFNPRLGWSHTVNVIDALDVYTLVEADGGYRFDGAIRPYDDVATEMLRVREPGGGYREEEVRLRRSVHGPVITGPDGAPLAVATPALELWGGPEQWWEMGRATNLQEFEAALRRLQIPMFTVMYADREGHILSVFGGRVPERPSGGFDAWQVPQRGDTSATLWTASHPYDDLPRVLDPEAGFAQNSNSPPWFTTMPSPLDPEAFPAYMSGRGLYFREQSGLTMLTRDESITFEELKDYRYSNRMLLADRLLDDLLPAARAAGGEAAAAAAVLEAWDREADATSRGAVLFAAWVEQLYRATSGQPFATPWSPDAPIATPDGLRDPAGAVAALEAAAAQVRGSFGALDVAWGDANRLGADPGLPGNGAPGDPLGVFHVVGYTPSEEGVGQATFGDTFVGAIEFRPDGPRAEVILAYGNFADADAPGVASQLELLASQQMRSALLERADIEAALAERVTLEPRR